MEMGDQSLGSRYVRNNHLTMWASNNVEMCEEVSLEPSPGHDIGAFYVFEYIGKA